MIICYKLVWLESNTCPHVQKIPSILTCTAVALHCFFSLYHTIISSEVMLISFSFHGNQTKNCSILLPVTGMSTWAPMLLSKLNYYFFFLLTIIFILKIISLVLPSDGEIMENLKIHEGKNICLPLLLTCGRCGGRVNLRYHVLHAAQNKIIVLCNLQPLLNQTSINWTIEIPSGFPVGSQFIIFSAPFLSEVLNLNMHVWYRCLFTLYKTGVLVVLVENIFLLYTGIISRPLLVSPGKWREWSKSLQCCSRQW